MSQVDAASTARAERVKSLQLPPNIRVARRRGVGWFKWIALLAFLGAVASLVWALKTGALNQAMASVPAADSPGATQTNLIKPPTSEIDPEAEKIALEAGGYLIPNQKVQVSPKVGGQVKELFIEEGKYFEVGSKLAVLEKDEYEFDYRRTKAAADLIKARLDELIAGSREEEKKQAEAALREAEQGLKQAAEELTKIERSGAAISFDEVDKAKSRVRIAEEKLNQQKSALKLIQEGPRKERIEAARFELEQAQFENAKAKWRLDNCIVLAPISGVILEKKTELGNTVRPEAFSNGLSASVCDMADLRKMEVEIDISERDIARIYKDQKCNISVEAFKDKKFSGSVARIMPIASRSKASVTVRVKVDIGEEEKDLRPEMRARVQFIKSDVQVAMDRKRKAEEEEKKKREAAATEAAKTKK